MRSGRRNRLFLLWIILFILLECALYLSYRIDDAYIHLQYARQWVATGDYAFNTGNPQFSDTSPLWVFLLAFGHGFLNLDLYLLCKAAGLLFGIGSLFIIYVIAARITPPDQKKYAHIAVFLFACDFWFRKFTFSGMETSMAVFWLLTFYYLYIFPKRRIFAFAAIGLLALTRPEGYFLLPVVWVDIIWNQKKNRAKTLLTGTGIFLTTVIPWWGYALPVFGTIFPYSARLKAGGGIHAQDMIHNIIRIAKLLCTNLLPWICWIAAVFISSGRKNLRKYWMFIAWPIIILILYTARVKNISARYMVILSPPIFIAGWLALMDFLHRFAKKQRIFIGGTIIVTVLISIAINIIIDVPYKKNYMDLLKNSEIAAGKWIEQNTAPTARVAAFDVGAVGYFSRREIIDYWYLITPEAHHGIKQTLMDYKPEIFIDKRRQGEPSAPIPSEAFPEVIFRNHHQGYRFSEKEPITVTLYKLHWKKNGE